MKNLDEILKQEAQALNACNKAMRNFPKENDEGELIELWKTHIDFALANDWPSTSFMKSNFSRSTLNEHLIYVDEHINIKDAPSGVYVINGDCSGEIRFSPWTAATIYVRHNSKISITALRFAKIFVHVYDDSEVTLREIDCASIKLYDKRE